MTLRHAASIFFYRQHLDDWGLAQHLGLPKRGNNAQSVRPYTSLESDLTTRLAVMRAYNRAVLEFKRAVDTSTDPVYVRVDTEACEVLCSLLISLRRQSELAASQTREIDRAIDHLISMRDALKRTADAWIGADEMPQATIDLNAFERSEIYRWIENAEDPIEIGLWEGISLLEWQGHIRLHDIVNNTHSLRSITGDLGAFVALRSILADGREVALDWDFLGHERAEARYEVLMGKIDDAISSLETLDSDQQWRKSV